MYSHTSFEDIPIIFEYDKKIKITAFEKYFDELKSYARELYNELMGQTEFILKYDQSIKESLEILIKNRKNKVRFSLNLFVEI